MKAKILIINPHFLFPCFLSISCAYLQSALKNASYQVDFLDLNIILKEEASEEDKSFWQFDHFYKINNPVYYKNELEDFFYKYELFLNNEIDKIIKQDYKYVLFSIYSTQKIFGEIVAEKIKTRDKNIKIIFGGPGCFKSYNNNIKDILRENEFIDYHVYAAEGEKIIVDLLDELENNKEVKTGGIIKRVGNQIIENPNPEIIKDINSIAMPDWGDFNLSLYAAKDTLPILFSRGCINKCVFCSEHQMFKYLRVRRAENVFAEMKIGHEKFGAKNFIFCDSSMNNNLIQLEKLCDLIIESGIRITFGGQVTFTQHFTKKFIKKLSLAGCNFLSFGLESGSQKVADLMNKNFNIKESEEVIKNATAAGIKVNLNFMFGFPGETRYDFQQSLKYLKRNKKNIDCVSPSHSFVILIKDTFLSNNWRDFNIKDHDKNNLGVNFDKESINDKNSFIARLKRYENNLGVNFNWELADGKNNIIIRLKRFEKFNRYTKKLGMLNTYGDIKSCARKVIFKSYFKEKNKLLQRIKSSKQTNDFDERALRIK